MTITFVGTGSGKTSLKRFHSSILISGSTNNCLIDCGDGISKALIQQSIDFNSIDTIIITHFHADHIGGLPALLTNMKLTGRTEPLIIYVFEKMKSFTESLLLHNYLSGLTKRFNLIISPYYFDKEIKLFESCKFIARKNEHIKNKDNISGYDIFYSASLLFTLKDKNIFYTSDIGDPADLFLFEDKIIDTMISETTHIPLNSIFSAAEKMKINVTYLTHISDEAEPEIFEKLENDYLHGKTTIASDGLKIFL